MYRRLKQAIKNLLDECKGFTKEQYQYSLNSGDLEVLEEFISEDKLRDKEHFKETIIDMLSEHFGDAMYCTRVWDAWGYGTMSSDDFEEIDEGAFAEFADELINKLDGQVE